jgi:hypothetical protein
MLMNIQRNANQKKKASIDHRRFPNVHSMALPYRSFWAPHPVAHHRRAVGAAASSAAGEIHGTDTRGRPGAALCSSPAGEGDGVPLGDEGRGRWSRGRRAMGELAWVRSGTRCASEVIGVTR